MKSAVFAVCCLVLLGGTFAGEAKEECTPLTEVAAGNTVLLAAVEAAGLVDLLTAPDAAFTIFAPTDEAFTDLLGSLEMTAEELLAETDTLTEILKFHVLPEPKTAADLSAGGAFPTALTESTCGTTDLTVTVEGETVSIGGGLTTATVSAADVMACKDTVVHVIDTVLVPCEAMPDGGVVADSSKAGGSD